MQATLTVRSMMNVLSPTLPSASTLLRRLVEAVESTPFGTTVYVVADPAFPHDVAAIDTTLSDRLRTALEERPGTVLYGPLTCTRGAPTAAQPSEQAAQARALTTARGEPGGEVWVHFAPSDWKKLRATTGVSGFQSLAAMIERGATTDGSVLSAALSLPPDQAAMIDTICFGPAAYRKFVVPYLVQVYGLDEAMRRVTQP